MNKAIFLDRDGIINVDTGYTHRIEDLEFEQGAIEGLKLLQSSGFKRIIVTGQSGIGRGYYSEEDYHIFMREMSTRLRMHRITIDGIYFCPHHPEKAIGKYKMDCNCRKPKIGMLEQAVTDHGIDLQQSWVVGDKTDDIEMGTRADCKTILVRTGKAGNDGHFKVSPTYVADNLLKAAQIIQKNERLN
ncbi:MAG: D-glycero-beta-D-manno-heptose 1,7-bisphosphate 7-phosphatase [Nanoarchaeota archaeon]|nr:D-glycero-beta-D-manno-heptose 1,7-bisphosphate 7-phosphatase [Nanoarchaeota archaeon]